LGAEQKLAGNPVFTQFFATEIQKEGVEVGQALRAVTSQVVGATKGRQTPWYNSSLLGDFYFRPVNLKQEEERRKKELHKIPFSNDSRPIPQNGWHRLDEL
jgi:uncharacterized caspase-like protein